MVVAQDTENAAIQLAQENKNAQIATAAATRDAILNDPNSNSYDITLANAEYQLAALNANLDYLSAKDAAQAAYDQELGYQTWLYGFCIDSGC